MTKVRHFSQIIIEFIRIYPFQVRFLSFLMASKMLLYM